MNVLSVIYTVRLKLALFCLFGLCLTMTSSGEEFVLLGEHPVAVRSAFKTIHTIFPWKDKLYMGTGNWGKRPGPIPLVSYAPKENTFYIEHSLGSDSVERFREIDHKLYALSIDPAHFREGTDFSVFDGTNWVDETALGFLHLFDIAKFSDNELWIAGSDGPRGALSRSMDGGKTWFNSTPPLGIEIPERYFWLFNYKNRIYVQNQYFDGDKWNESDLKETKFQNATVISNEHGNVVIGINQSKSLIRFDGLTQSETLNRVSDFYVSGTTVYALSLGTAVQVCTNITQVSPSWHSLPIDSVPGDARSIAILNDVVYIGTDGGELYAAGLPASSVVINPEAPAVKNNQADLFGTALASDDHWLVAGAPHEAGAHPENGAVYVYQRKPETQNWVLHTKLAASVKNQKTGRFFGKRVSISGNSLAIAETGTSSDGLNRGEHSVVYVYRFNKRKNTWTLTQKFKNPYVQSICLEGKWLAFGGTDSFEIRKWNGNSFQLIAGQENITIPSPISASWPLVEPYISGKLMYVTIQKDVSFSGNGEIWVFKRDENDIWKRDRKILSPSKFDGFARSISVNKSRLAVGAPRHDILGASSNLIWKAGAVHLIDVKSQAITDTIYAPEPEFGLEFGSSVLLDGSDLFVGTGNRSTATERGTIYHYTFNDGSWDLHRRIKVEGHQLGAALTSVDKTLISGLYYAKPDQNQLNRLFFTAYEPEVNNVEIPDAWIMQYFGQSANFNPLDDPDGDRQNNLEEYIAGSDPTNASSYFQINLYQNLETAGSIIQWTSVPERQYQLYWSTNLLHGFESLAEDIEFPQNRYTNRFAPNNEANFYKINFHLK